MPILPRSTAFQPSVSMRRSSETRIGFRPTSCFNLVGRSSKALKAQTATSGMTNSSQIAMSSEKHRGKAYRPYAFTEHGALQAANVLRSTRAVQMSLFVIRAFVKMREQIMANAAIFKRLAEIDKTLLYTTRRCAIFIENPTASLPHPTRLSHRSASSHE